MTATEQTSQRDARSRQIRQIFARVAGRSFAGTKEDTFLRDLDLRGAQEDEIAWLIGNQLGVAIRPLDWGYFVHVRDVVEFVERHQRGSER